MNEHTLSSFAYNALIISSEIAVVLLAILIVVTVMALRQRKKKKALTNDFLDDVKANSSQREKEIKNKLDNISGLDDEAKAKVIESLLTSEKKVFLHVAQLYMGYKEDSLKELEDEMKNVSKFYADIIEKVSEGGGGGGTGDEDNNAAMRELKKQVTALREEKKSLKEKNEQLQIDFDAAMDSMERMTTEFANMYEGGSKEGEKAVKNEMYKLRQTLAQKKEFTEADNDESSEADEAAAPEGDEVPDMDISDSDENAEAK